MASPSPAPSFTVSAWVKGSNMCGRNSAAIPPPSSATSIRNSYERVPASIVTLLPEGECLIAL